MAYSEHIKLGISYLLKSQNIDGGISKDFPESKISGVWTTAESLEAILSSENLQFNISTLDNLILMANYLIQKFIVVEEDDCGYWEIADGEGASTMATGHTIYALQTFSNKILTGCELEAIVLLGKIFTIAEIKKAINECTQKGFKWLQDNQQIDNGWSYTCKLKSKHSTNLCAFYVLKGYQALGRTIQNDGSMHQACLHIKERIVRLISSNVELETSMPEVLYGFTCLHSCGYFTKSEIDLKNRIIKYINRHWKIIKKCVDFGRAFESDSNSTSYIKYVNNMPYIALNAFLISEEYSVSRKLKKLIEYLISNKVDGEWVIYKGKKKETTWVTAEAVLAFNLAQKKLIRYENNVVRKKREKTLTVAGCVLSAICTVFFIYYFAQQAISSDIIQALPNGLVALLGAISSVISIIEVFRK